MTVQLFQTIYLYSSLVIVLFLSAMIQKKEGCTCSIKVPSSIIALIATTAIGFINGLNPLTFILIAFIFTGALGSYFFGKIGNISGGITYLIGYIIIFSGFEIFGIKQVINMGFENVSIFGALLAITTMFLKKQENTIIIYVLGLSIFFLTAIFSAILPFVLASILICLSEIMLIYNNDFEDKNFPEEMAKKTVYFSAALYSYGMLLIPLTIL